MKLLLPNENKDTREQENVRQIIRTQELEAATKKARLELADSQANFQSTLALNRQKWAEEEEEHLKQVGERKQELTTLETERKQALAPINEIKELAETKLKEATQWFESLKVKEEDLDQTSELLQDKLDEVGQREQDLLAKEKTLLLREEGLERQSISNVESTRRLSEAIASFAVTKQAWEKESSELREQLFLNEISVQAKLDKVKDKEQVLDQKQAKIDDSIKALELKRKEALIPVKELIANAEKVLSEANLKRQEALELTNKAQIDYPELLNSLNDRKEGLIKESERLKNIEKVLERRANEANVQRIEFNEQSEKLNTEKGKFESEWKEWQSEKTKIYNEAENLLKQAKKERIRIEDALYKVEQLEISNVMTLDAIKERQSVLDNQSIEIQNKQTEVSQSIKEHTQLKLNTEQAVNEMISQKQEFIIWKTDIEKKMEQQALENSGKQKQLANKEEKINRQEKFLSEWSVKLKDERGVLDRMYKEVQRMQANIPLLEKD